MRKHGIQETYFEWIYNMVCDEKYNMQTYQKLLSYLFDRTFDYELGDDRNRYSDGVDFRYQFGYQNDYPMMTIKKFLDNRPCSVLEMIIALAYRLEDQIMDDEEYGNRTAQWFWNMISSLGLAHMNDDQFDLDICEEVVDDFLHRRYEPNGRGGLFTLNNPQEDLRYVDIWTQAMWYLDENFDFSI